MILISRVASDHDDAPDTGTAGPGASRGSDAVSRLVSEASREDGRSPLNEATLLSLRHHGVTGKTLWVAHEDGGPALGFALAEAEPGRSAAANPAASHEAVAGSREVEVNLVVAPGARRNGVGTALAEAALETFGHEPITAWSHGNHPGAARLAGSLGFERVRDLWLMRRLLSQDHPLPEVPGTGGIVVRPFRPGEDEDAFLALNAEAFAGHPEQGSMTRADLDQRTAERWFDPGGFFLAEPQDAPRNEANALVDSPSLLGFHWTKVHQEQDPPVGEVYVLGISPAAQGRGLGRLLTLTGLHHLRGQGLGEVILYVEADNAPAIAMYRALGFTHADEDTDVQYARAGSAG